MPCEVMMMWPCSPFSQRNLPMLVEKQDCRIYADICTYICTYLPGQSDRQGARTPTAFRDGQRQQATSPPSLSKRRGRRRSRTSVAATRSLQPPWPCITPVQAWALLRLAPVSRSVAAPSQAWPGMRMNRAPDRRPTPPQFHVAALFPHAGSTRPLGSSRRHSVRQRPARWTHDCTSKRLQAVCRPVQQLSGQSQQAPRASKPGDAPLAVTGSAAL